MSDPTARLNTALEGRYRIEHELGEGGMATVYLAHDVRHDRPVALKVLKPELAAVVGAERFLAEIKTTANLQHPHILPLFDSGEADSFLFYVMPYVEGESLREKLDREKQLPVDEAVRIAAEVADALGHAHGKGVIHRDIKPANILLRDGHVQVADFGIALAVQEAGGSRLTETGLSIGTPAYMSPEQATGDRPLDGRTDVYSVGCVLYEMLVGDPPHVASTAQAILSKILMEEPKSISQVRRSVPAHVSAAVDAALEKLPADRIQSAAEFSAVLAADATAPRIVRSAPGGRGKTLWMGWLVAAVATTVAAVAVVNVVQGPRPQAMGTDPFTFSFALDPAEQVVVDIDQVLFDISNDGEVIAWIGGAAGSVPQVFYRSIRDLAVHRVPGTEGVDLDIWMQLSPDGRQVSFLRDDELLAVPLDGSRAPQSVFKGRLWSWTQADDGSFVLGEPYRGLLRLAEPGGTPEVLTRLEGDEVTHQFPQVLPDGRSVLFSVGVGSFHAARIEVLSFDGATSSRKVVLEDAYSATYVASGHLVFGRGDRILTVPFDVERLSVTGPETTVISGVQTDASGVLTEFAVSRNGTLVYLPGQGLVDRRLAWMGRDGGIEWLGVPASPFKGPRISPDGNAVAFTTLLDGDVQRQIYVIDLDRLVSRRLTNGSVNDAPIWSPDGSELLFSSGRDGHINLYRAPVDGPARITRVSASTLDQYPLGWSREGHLVYLERLPYDRRRILWGSLDDPGLRGTPVTPEEVSEAGGDLSPDGRWFAVEREGQVFVRGLSAAEDAVSGEEQVSRAGGQVPRWSPDGRALLYASPDARRILSVDFDATEGLHLGREIVVFVVPDDVELDLGWGQGYDAAADGRILVVARQIRTTPVQVVVSMNLIGR